LNVTTFGSVGAEIDGADAADLAFGASDDAETAGEYNEKAADTAMKRTYVRGERRCGMKTVSSSRE